MTDIAARYIAVWNETDAAKRRHLVDELFTEDATYTDPLAEVAGRDGIDMVIAGAQQQFAGLVFSVPAEADAHHDIARFQWHLGVAGEAEPLVIGFDVVRVNGDRISSVLGFLDRIPG
ncbi:nuclear transport factor 2 family protein [Allokutzneria multivorans]|uniref:Nuclear transport factor 2 family protein n=1 Tax=Allokutzneria multivorans TaxID=1142134 RepID=A0ABP7T0R6_9PSEU